MVEPTSIDVEGFRRLEQAGWIEVASGYDDAFSRLTRLVIEPLLDAAGVRKGNRLLDVATGPGRAVAAATARGAQAVGIDFSPAMVEQARRLHPGLDFRVGDAEALAFGDGEFDAVTIAFGVLHFARPEQALGEALRVLRPGGRLAFTVWDRPERARTFGLILEAIAARGKTEVGLPQGPDFFKYADPATGREALEALGFSSPRIETLPLLWRVDSADALLDGFLEGGVRTRALLRAQTPEALESIRAEVRVTTRQFQKDGGLELPAPAVLVSGTKP